MLEPGSSIEHDVRILGTKSGEERQIDVAVRGLLGQAPALVVVECKEHTRRIDVGRIDAFVGFLDDIGATSGILVTSAGYSQAALQRAAAAQIETWVLRPAEDSDWEGYLRTLSLKVICRGIVYRDCAIKLQDGRSIPVTPMKIMYDPTTDKQTFFDRIMNHALRDGFENGKRTEATLLQDLFVEVEDGQQARVVALLTTPSMEDLFTTESISTLPEDWVYVRETPESRSFDKEFFVEAVLKQIAEGFKTRSLASSKKS